MKKTIAIVLAMAIALVLFSGCTRKGYNYYPGQFIPANNNYNPAPSVAQAHNYYFGPYVSVVTGTLTSKTIFTTEGRGNSAAYLYMLNTAHPINISKVNIPDDSDVITANNVAAFELAVSNMNLSAYLGSKVRVTGQFSLGDYGNDSTRTVMDVSKLEIYNTEPVSQYNAWGYEQDNAQGKTQGGTQINVQGNAQINIQNSTQSGTLNAGKPAPAATKQPPKKTAPAPAATKPPIKKPAPASVATKPKPKPTVQASQCPPPKTYRIQVGAYCNSANAQSVMTQLQCQNLNPVKENYLQYTRVVLRGISANKVKNTVAAVRRAGFDDPWIQPE